MITIFFSRDTSNTIQEMFSNVKPIVPLKVNLHDTWDRIKFTKTVEDCVGVERRFTTSCHRHQQDATRPSVSVECKCPSSPRIRITIQSRSTSPRSLVTLPLPPSSSRSNLSPNPTHKLLLTLSGFAACPWIYKVIFSCHDKRIGRLGSETSLGRGSCRCCYSGRRLVTVRRMRVVVTIVAVTIVGGGGGVDIPRFQL